MRATRSRRAAGVAAGGLGAVPRTIGARGVRATRYGTDGRVSGMQPRIVRHVGCWAVTIFTGQGLGPLSGRLHGPRASRRRHVPSSRAVGVEEGRVKAALPLPERPLQPLDEPDSHRGTQRPLAVQEQRDGGDADPATRARKLALRYVAEELHGEPQAVGTHHAAPPPHARSPTETASRLRDQQRCLTAAAPRGLPQDAPDGPYGWPEAEPPRRSPLPTDGFRAPRAGLRVRFARVHRGIPPLRFATSWTAAAGDPHPPPPLAARKRSERGYRCRGAGRGGEGGGGTLAPLADVLLREQSVCAE